MSTAQTRTLDLDIHDLSFRFGDDFELSVPRLHVPAGHTAVCIGPSGSGKSTLMQLCAGILTAASGRVVLGDVDWATLSERARRLRRITEVGLVFQEFELLEHLSVLENILLPYHVQRDLRFDANARQRAHELAAAAGIEGLLQRKPRKLSQGERQRVAICRALVTQPSVSSSPTSRPAISIPGRPRCRDRVAPLSGAPSGT